MSDEIVVSESVRLGTLEIAPTGVIARATQIATELAALVNARKLYVPISGKKYVRVEGWTTLGAMLGVTPREVSTITHEDGTFEAMVEIVRSDGTVVGRGSAICGMDEPTWAKRPAYARRSMAITRATGKAFRLAYSWIMTLAGYEATPAEEIVDAEPLNDVDKTFPPKLEPKSRQLPSASEDRPYPPVVFKTKLGEMATKIKSSIADGKTRPCTDINRKVLAATLGKVWLDKEQTERYETCLWLTGESSTKKISGEFVLALLRVMEVSNFDDEPIDVARQELIQAHSAALIASGQQILEGMDNPQ